VTVAWIDRERSIPGLRQKSRISRDKCASAFECVIMFTRTRDSSCARRVAVGPVTQTGSILMLHELFQRKEPAGSAISGYLNIPIDLRRALYIASSPC